MLCISLLYRYLSLHNLIAAGKVPENRDKRKRFKRPAMIQKGQRPDFAKRRALPPQTGHASLRLQSTPESVP